MLRFSLLYIGVATIVLIADGLWLGFIARDFYRQHLGALMADNPNLVAAAAFYLLYCAGVVMFVAAPALASGSISEALLRGAAFGLIAYGTFDLTSLAILRGFSTVMAIVDMVWGAVLTATGAAGAVALTKWLLPKFAG